MFHKYQEKSSFPLLKNTSTPYRVKRESISLPDCSQDTGYGTRSSTFLSPGRTSEKDIFPESIEVHGRTGIRNSLRGKRRVDILSALMSFEKSEYILLKILRYLTISDRLTVLSVCKSWYSLKLRFPRLFTASRKHEKILKDNSAKFSQRSTTSRKPLSAINCPNSCTIKNIVDKFDTKEFLHPCPVCSGVAFYRPNEWPNRLHCQALDCGISVCYNCQREHSPSDKCQMTPNSPVYRLSPIQPRASPTRSPRARARLMKSSLRRL
ncbi:unnamed protein product [Schistosoma margrebowiei]|uniref:F-box domain-containing protein n=1 Tax=Schistosoma margrebowiei TaxID=48269 RepID=A0AA85ANM7_9TREM|nr:unnamed protein product [Schistosoma margrebowiei]